MAEVKNMSKMGSESSGMPSGMSMSLTGDPNVKMDLEPTAIAGPYCASGVASCGDLNQKKACICPSCQVYSEYKLMKARPVEHYCFNDKAV